MNPGRCKSAVQAGGRNHCSPVLGALPCSLREATKALASHDFQDSGVKAIVTSSTLVQNRPIVSIPASVRYRRRSLWLSSLDRSPRMSSALPVANTHRVAPGRRSSTMSEALGRASTFRALRVDEAVSTKSRPSSKRYPDRRQMYRSVLVDCGQCSGEPQIQNIYHRIPPPGPDAVDGMNNSCHSCTSSRGHTIALLAI